MNSLLTTILVNIGFIIICPIPFILQIILSPVYLFRFILSQICKLFGRRIILSSLSSLFVFPREKTKTAGDGVSHLWNGPNVLITLKLTGPLDTKEFMERLNSRVIYLKRADKPNELLYPELQEEITIWLGYPFFKKVRNFCTENHIFEHDISNNTKEQTAFTQQKFEAEALQISNEFINRPWTPGRSPWEFLIVRMPSVYSQDIEPTSQSTVLHFRFHHALGDGFSVLEAFLKVADTKVVTKSVSSTGSTILQKTWFYLTLPILGCYQTGTIGCELLFATMTRHLYFKNRKLCNAETAKNKYFDITPNLSLTVPQDDKVYFGQTSLIPTSEIKNIATAYKVTFSSVLLSTIAVGVRQYLKSRFQEKDIPDYVFLAMPFPSENRPNKFTNRYGSMILRLPLKLDKIEDALAYCNNNELISKKWIHYVRPTEGFFKKIFTLLPVTWKSIPVGGDPLTPITVNIFRGPLEPLQILSHSVESMFYRLNMQCLSGVNVTICSYNSKSQMTICASKMPIIISSQQEMDEFVSEVENQIAVLRRHEKFYEKEEKMDV